MWISIVSVPDLYLFIYFVGCSKIYGKQGILSLSSVIINMFNMNFQTISDEVKICLNVDMCWPICMLLNEICPKSSWTSFKTLKKWPIDLKLNHICNG